MVLNVEVSVGSVMAPTSAPLAAKVMEEYNLMCR